jgi:WD40 repeat protein
MARFLNHAGGERLSALIGLLLLAAFPNIVLAQYQPSAATQPKIVLQTVPFYGIDVAAWTPDDKYVVSASGTTRELIIWDVGKGVILDRLRFPAGGATGAEFMRLTGIAVDPDGRTIRIKGVITDLTKGAAPLGRAYAIDLQTRAIQVMPPPDVPASANSLEDSVRWSSALGALYDGGTDMTRAEAEKLLPALPPSHDGSFLLKRNEDGFDIVSSASGALQPMQAKAAALGLEDAGLAPDGRRIALLHLGVGKDPDGTEFSNIDLFDTLTARYSPQVKLRGDYGAVRWMNETQFLAYAGISFDDPNSGDADVKGPPPPIMIVDATSGRATGTMPARCFVERLSNKGYIGAGLANCRTGAGDDRSLARFEAATGQWRALEAFALEDGEAINLVTVAPGGTRLAVVSTLKTGVIAISLVDPESGSILDGKSLPDGGRMTKIGFSADGKTLFLAGNGGVTLWQIETGKVTDLVVRVLLPTMFASDGKNLLIAGPGEDVIARVDLATGNTLPPLDFSNATAGGFLPGRPVFWAASAVNGLRLWDTRNWSVLLTTYFFENQEFVAVAPDGRYDTNLGPDASLFRWLIPDENFQSLAPQTFMRDYFEPRLSQRLIDCTTARNCDAVFGQPRSIVTLNRVLPTVRITQVVPGKTAAEALVSVEVTDTFDPSAANGKTRSGVYGVRLMLNNSQVARNPDNSSEPLRQTLAEWQKINNKANDYVPADGVYRWTFTLEVPTAPGTERQVFSAYSFNEDRVKSDTAHFTYIRPPVTPRKRRAFVLTIGIDAYEESRLELNYAVADARLIADRLAMIPGYETEMRRTTLAGAKRPDGSVQPVTRNMINTALGILAGFPPAESIEELRVLGIDASALANATPDDIVIISFSGHGWADKEGNFFLVPSDGKWATGEAMPVTDTLISAADLTMWLRAMTAADIVFIIDACHSGASVDAGSFKPGPMGDSGLGQLSFDKGVRILAATQANDVALESSALGQGLLTAALAEGLTQTGEVRLDAWLRYAVKRLPSLGLAARSGAGPSAGARGFTISNRTPVSSTKVQEPVLFDFNKAPSTVVLKAKRQ